MISSLSNFHFVRERERERKGREEEREREGEFYTTSSFVDSVNKQ